MTQSFQSLIEDKKPVLVDFSADWCGPCKMLAPILQELKSSLADQIKIIKIDVDRNPAISQHYQIQSVPTLILFAQSKILWRQSGVLPAYELEKVIRQKING